MNGPVQFSWDSRASHRDAIRDSLREFGTVLIADAGLNQALVSELICAQRKVFSLPELEKRKHTPDAGPSITGYIAFATESAGGHHAPDPKECWHISANPRLKNFWPEEIPEFKTAADRLCPELRDFSMQLLEFFGGLLGRAREFSKLLERDESILRMIRYSTASAVGTVLAEAHRDIGIMTLHLHQSRPGFQILSAKGWGALDPAPGILAVSAGEMLEFVSDGNFLAPVHRVVNMQADGRHREYAGFFVHPAADAVLESKTRSVVSRDMIAARLHDMRLLSSEAT